MLQGIEMLSQTGVAHEGEHSRTLHRFFSIFRAPGIQSPRLVLLDDIERGLHIEAQARLVDVLRSLMEIDPELQIVCTTHSPYLLDRFDASEVRVLELDANRHTHAQSLAAHPEFSRWKYGVQTGELWAALGSGWVAGPEEQPK